ncbi:MAG: NAD(P)-dependent oxidoreductase [Thermodesulfobacteriota bacterium]
MTCDLKGRRIVLVGGAGFIGHNLALTLAESGAHVEVIDSLQVNNLLWFASGSGGEDNRKLYVSILNQRLDLLHKAGIPFHLEDARDYFRLSMVLDKIKPDVVIHLAAVAHAGRANKDPYSTFDHSLRTLENSLDFARTSAEHFIFLSSSMVYGNFQSQEVDETHALEPIGIYGALKLGGEKLVIAYNQVFGLNYTIIRPSALYGPRCVSRRVGQVFVENALNGAKLRVDGDGAERLDFTYVDDFVHGVCLCIEKREARNQIFNITYGQARSIADMVGIVQQYFPRSQVEYRERDKLMPMRGTLSVAKAKQLLGYAPENPLEVGFPKYIEWYRQLQQDGHFWMELMEGA